MFEKRHFSTLPSTHLWARSHASTLTRPTMITTDNQTAGVGRRRETTWLAPSGKSLIATFFIPKMPSLASHNLAQLLAYSLIMLLKKTGVFPLFKWPNDLLLSEKKFAGCMADCTGGNAILSCGMNVNVTKEELSAVNKPATSLLIETHSQFPINELKNELAEQLTRDLHIFTTQQLTPFLPTLREYLAYRGQRVAVDHVEGVLVDLHEDGRLILLRNGKHHLVATGSLIRL